jgi:phosphoglycolate phosphatase-like HAD superfamily hydrolase|tara:strand:+ start:76 stop:477 length:402 start_codon:yes stop_codon:yes gene_type:complete
MNTPNLPKTVFVDIDGTIIKHHGGLENSLNELLKPTYVPTALPNVQERIWEWDSKNYTVILTTGRKESSRRVTEEQLEKLGIVYDQLIMGIGPGPRVLINDADPDFPETKMAMGITLERDEGIGSKKIDSLRI